VTGSVLKRCNPVPVLATIAGAAGLAVGVLKVGAVPIVGLCMLLWLVPFFCRRPFLLILLWLALPPMYEIAQAPFVSLGNLGPIVLVPQDVPIFFTIAFLITAAISRPRETLDSARTTVFVSLFLAMVLVSVALYTPIYGKMAIGEARKDYFLLLFPLTGVLSIRTFSDLRRLMLAVYWLALCMTVVCLVVFLQHPSMDRYAVPLVGDGSLLTLFVAFSILTSHANGVVIMSKAIDGVVLLLLLLVTVLARTRTVFMAGGLGVLLVFCLRGDKARFLRRAFAVSIAFFLVIGSAFYVAPGFTQEFVSPLAGIIDPGSDRHASWRMEGWRQQMAALSESELVFGKGVGSYFKWYDRAEEVTVGPHNVYVQILIKFGLLGLAAYGLLVFTFFRRMLAVRRALPPGPARAYVEMSILNFGAAHAYMTGYGFSLIMFVFYAIGMAALSLVKNVSYALPERRQEFTGDSAPLAQLVYARTDTPG
jgi:O-antigen ligase